jgi:AhpD family alkylhydroperoxidase
MHTTRIDINKHLSSPFARALFQLSAAARQGMNERLFTLVEIRASQINGCAYCIDMHTKEARAAGETEQRLYALSAWRETPFFSERERAALDWTETVTLVAETHVPDDAFARVSEHFGEEEVLALTFAVIVINSWNRLSVAFRPLVGSYQPKTEPVAV